MPLDFRKIELVWLAPCTARRWLRSGKLPTGRNQVHGYTRKTTGMQQVRVKPAHAEGCTGLDDIEGLLGGRRPKPTWASSSTGYGDPRGATVIEHVKDRECSKGHRR